MVNSGSSEIIGKVARILRRYDLEDFGRKMEQRWTAKGDDRMSLRELSAMFNRRILREHIIRAGMNASDLNIEMIYEAMTCDEVSPGVQTEVRNRLSQNGINVEEVENEFVSYQAVRTYLQTYRGAVFEELTDREKMEKDKDSIQRLLRRTQSVIEDRIGNLQSTGRQPETEYDVIVTAEIICHNCAKQISVIQYLDDGCECE